VLSVVRDEIGHVPTLLQPARSPAPSARPDEVQQAAIEHRGAVLRILGAPGSGKSWLATRIVAERVAGGELAADACLILAPSRLSAARLRDGRCSRWPSG
jgi:superfamily II DNA or RNA helicase